MSGKFNQPEFLVRQEEERVKIAERRVWHESQPGSAKEYRAEFAWCVSGGPPSLHVAIIPHEIGWHEWVRGNGCSYSPVLDVPSVLFPTQDQSLREFKAWARKIAQEWEVKVGA